MKKFNDLNLEIATIEVMLISLYNSMEDVIKAISPKTKIEKYETWLQQCEDVAKKLLEKESESENNG